MNYLLGDGHTCASTCAAHSRSGAGLSAVRIKLRAGETHTGPVPHRDGNSALGVMGTPKQDFNPRTRKERNYIAQKSSLSTNCGQVLTSACCTFAAGQKWKRSAPRQEKSGGGKTSTAVAELHVELTELRCRRTTLRSYRRCANPSRRSGKFQPYPPRFPGSRRTDSRQYREGFRPTARWSLSGSWSMTLRPVTC